MMKASMMSIMVAAKEGSIVVATPPTAMATATATATATAITTARRSSRPVVSSLAGGGRRAAVSHGGIAESGGGGSIVGGGGAAPVVAGQATTPTPAGHGSSSAAASGSSTTPKKKKKKRKKTTTTTAAAPDAAAPNNNNGGGPAPAAVYNPRPPPLNAYNLFFRHERARLLAFLSDDDEAPRGLRRRSVSDLQPPRGLTVENVRSLLESSAHIPGGGGAAGGKKKKRKHRKSHGVVGFTQLNKIVSTNWKALNDHDPESKAPFFIISKELKVRYVEEETARRGRNERDLLQQQGEHFAASPLEEEVVVPSVPNAVDNSCTSVPSMTPGTAAAAGDDETRKTKRARRKQQQQLPATEALKRTVDLTQNDASILSISAAAPPPPSLPSFVLPAENRAPPFVSPSPSTSALSSAADRDLFALEAILLGDFADKCTGSALDELLPPPTPTEKRCVDHFTAQKGHHHYGNHNIAIAALLPHNVAATAAAIPASLPIDDDNFQRRCHPPNAVAAETRGHRQHLVDEAAQTMTTRYDDDPSSSPLPYYHQRIPPSLPPLGDDFCWNTPFLMNSSTSAQRQQQEEEEPRRMAASCRDNNTAQLRHVAQHVLLPAAPPSAAVGRLVTTTMGDNDGSNACSRSSSSSCSSDSSYECCWSTTYGPLDEEEIVLMSQLDWSKV